MTFSECQQALATVVPLLERADGLLALAIGSERTRKNFALAQRAGRLWQSGTTEADAARWLSVIGNRCLAAALDTRLAPIVLSGDAGSRSAGDSRALAGLLLEISAAVAAAEQRLRAPTRGADIPARVLGVPQAAIAPSHSGPSALPMPKPRIDIAVPEPAPHDRPMPPPPALIGPLAGTLAHRPLGSEAPSEAPAETPPAAKEAPAAAEAPSLERYPLARCAAIAASIGRRKADKAAILEKHELTDARWTELDQHWADVIRVDSQRGGMELLAAYDDAYVAQLEKERGPITVEDFAKLTIASERGVQADALAALDLPKAAVPRLERVWLRKTAGDKALAKRLRAAVEEGGA